jgi:hypothetical protein
MSVSKCKTKKKNVSHKINKIGVTTDTLTSRGGLSLFATYLENTQILTYLGTMFGVLRKNAKGQSIENIFKQILCYLMDGTSRTLTYFDQLKKDPGYTASLEFGSGELLSSHSVKRFFKSFSMPLVWCFRKVLKQLFLWRLRLKKPLVILLGIDSMVMDNDEAVKRHGVQPTYKKRKGFHPVQMIWERFIIDAIFRGGSKHCHSGNTVAHMVRDIVKLIRTQYRDDVAIVFLLDSGFFDEKLFEVFETLKVGYVCSGKMYSDLTDYAESLEDRLWNKYTQGNNGWSYYDYKDKRSSWSRPRRAILSRFTPENPQQVFDAFRPLTILYTNLGMSESIDDRLKQVGQEELLKPDQILQMAHGRGRDELVHRAFKDFGFEELPFKRFAPNAAFYYTMVVGHFLYECFKEDTCSEVIPVESYASTFRRKVIDTAMKIVQTGHEIWIKFTQTAWDTLRLDQLWERCNNPPKFAWS